MRKKEQWLTGIIFGALVLCLPGCTRIFKWVDCAVYQGEEVVDQIEPARGYIRTVTVHSDIRTIGRFSAVWVSDRLRTLLANADSYYSGGCKSNEWVLPGENKHGRRWSPTFYLVTLKKAAIDTACSNWHLFLCVGGKRYCPVYIKEVEPCTTTSLLLQDYLTPFSQLYEIGFAIPPEELQSAIIQLCFRSAEKQASLTWNSSLEYMFKPQQWCDWRALV